MKKKDKTDFLFERNRPNKLNRDLLDASLRPQTVSSQHSPNLPKQAIEALMLRSSQPLLPS